MSEFSSLFASNNPDLSAFKKDGSKIIIWHGLSDQLIFPQGTVRYYNQVQRAMGGPSRTDSFARLFLAPGAAALRQRGRARHRPIRSRPW